MAEDWRELARQGGVSHTAGRIDRFLNEVAESEFKTFLEAACAGDGYALTFLGALDADEAVDNLKAGIDRISFRHRSTLARWGRLRKWMALPGPVRYRYVRLSKVLPGLLTMRSLRQVVMDPESPSDLRALAASALLQFPAEETLSLWQGYDVSRFPECLGAALVGVARARPDSALSILSRAGDIDVEPVAYSIVTAVQCLVEFSGDPVTLRRQVDVSGTVDVITAAYGLAGRPLPAAIASLSSSGAIDAVTEREFLIDRHQFGTLEAKIREWRGFTLQGVHPVLPKLEVPDNSLREAVLGHLDRDIPYNFYMPANILPEEFGDQLGTYRTMVRGRWHRGRDRERRLGLITGTRLEQVQAFPYPYVFYEMLRGNERIVLGVRGTERGRGIADHYIPIEAPEAETILALLGVVGPSAEIASAQDSMRAVRELLREVA